jgi:hypothetical protein
MFRDFWFDGDFSFKPKKKSQRWDRKRRSGV